MSLCIPVVSPSGLAIEIPLSCRFAQSHSSICISSHQRKHQSRSLFYWQFSACNSISTQFVCCNSVSGHEMITKCCTSRDNCIICSILLRTFYLKFNEGKTKFPSNLNYLKVELGVKNQWNGPLSWTAAFLPSVASTAGRTIMGFQQHGYNPLILGWVFTLVPETSLETDFCCCKHLDWILHVFMCTFICMCQINLMCHIFISLKSLMYC